MFRTLSDIETYMNSIPMFSKHGLRAANFNLDTITNVCRILGNPHSYYKTIHVAGTNGKGTVCRMLASVYQSGGYKTGVYTSPHLTSIRERFRIDGIVIPESDLIQFFNTWYQDIKNEHVTYFEITTAIAFWFFWKHNVDIAIIETGLGGRLDATNIINPEASVITSIGMDHTDILGTDPESIAREKGGIIKKNRPVIIGDLTANTSAVLNDIADSLNSKVIPAMQFFPEYHNGKMLLKKNETIYTVQASHLKKIDAVNTAIVFAVIGSLQKEIPVSIEAFADGIESLDQRYPVRGVFEKLRSDKEWYFDGAHNYDSITSLIMHLLEIAPVNKWTVVLSFMKDKLTPDVAELWNRFPNLRITGMTGERSAELSEMKELFPHAEEIKLNERISENEFETELVIFSGSFYFYGRVSEWLGTTLASKENLSALT